MNRLRSATGKGAPDPEDALRRLERIERAAAAAQLALPDHPAAVATVALVCQRAPYLATLLARDPRRLERVASDPYLYREKSAAAMAVELGRHLGATGGGGGEFRACLRRYRADEMVRLGCRELEHGTAAEVGRELAHLADVCFDAAIAFYSAALIARYGAPRYTDETGRECEAELAVIGMGKLGGEELNFCSDVDVIYVYSSDQGAAGAITLHEYFSKLAEQVSSALGEATEEDLVFRVDLRLRPEGSRGAIANSLPSLEPYYESWGRPWERQAWLKARASAGSRALGQRVLATLEPFIYPRHISASVIDEVTDLNRRIKAEIDGASIESGFDVKNGVGGIREIEFFVQALQLIHAGRRPSLRARSTMVALDQLLFAGLVTEGEHRTLAEAYRTLRRIEHLLQLDGGRQTQRLPSNDRELHRFARRAGFADAASLHDALRIHTEGVARLFATLGEPEDAPPGEITALLSGALPGDRERAILADLGFRDARAAHRHLERARARPLSPFSVAAHGSAQRIGPALLFEWVRSPDPDQALSYLVEVIGRRGSWSMWNLFSENRSLMRLIASLFATSSYLSKVFVSHPELLDWLLLSGQARAVWQKNALRAQLAATLADDEEEEGRWNRLAEFKQGHVLRIGLADIGGELDAAGTSAELSKLAEVCLGQAFSFVADILAERHGTPRDERTGEPVTLTILAMGKLGASELGYASDLDVIFIYSADGQSDGAKPLDNVTYMTRLAQRLMRGLHAHHPSGRLYELDTRLRPSGSQGLLVSSLAAWENYHRGPARLWERQALIKLRAVAGDMELGERIAAAARDLIWGRAPGTDGKETAAEIARHVAAMRDRIERELAGGEREHDVKTGRGGLLDIEFAAQFLQLAHGHHHAELRVSSTVAALGAAAELGVAAPQDCILLRDGYHFLRTLENRMRIVHDLPVHRLPRGQDLERLARRVGYPGGAALKAAYRRWTGEIRAAYQRTLGVGSGPSGAA